MLLKKNQKNNYHGFLTVLFLEVGAKTTSLSLHLPAEMKDKSLQDK